MSACPSHLELERHTSDGGEPELAAHVAGCARCRAALDEIAANNRVLAELVDSGAASSRAIELEGYRIGHERFRGGQGDVYKAVQLSTQRTVAVKVLLEGTFASPEKQRRFEREIELAASLDHPYIVRLYDSSVTKSGQRFFVMEYIEGAPLDARTPGARSRADRDAALRLFAKVCRGVNFAHQQGVIHRDLKPGNVLVDSGGDPHILDFGVAKGVGEGGEGPELTASGVFVGTLAYASPEQVGGDGSRVDLRTDVYSLGVILFELLTGRLPYDTAGGMAEVVLAITSAEPARPAGLDRDLRTILQKALAKDPERRYQTAGALADDVERHLAGLPIDARRDSTWYVVGKLLRRHRVPAALLAIVLVALVASAVTSTAFWRVSVREARAATRESRANARVVEFTKRLFALQSPDRTLGETVTVKELLDANTESLWQELGEEPELQGELLLAAGEMYQALGLHPEARGLFERAWTLSRGALGDDAEGTLVARSRLGLACLHVGKLDEAEAHLGEAALGLERAFGRADERTASALVDLAALHQARERFPEAESLLLEVANLREEQWGAEHPGTIGVRTNLALLYEAEGRYDDARRILEDGLATLRRTLPEEDPRTLNAAHNLAFLLDRGAHFEEAEPLYLEALAGRRRVLSEEHPDTLATLNNLAVLYTRMGRLDEAEERFRAALAIQERALPPDHLGTLTTLNSLGVLMQKRGRLDEAGELLQRALDGRRLELGETHSATMKAASNLAGVLEDEGEWDAAERLRLEALDAFRANLPPDHPQTLTALQNLAAHYAARGRYSDAEPLLREALAGRRRALSLAHPDTRATLFALAITCERLGRPVEAEALVAELLDLLPDDDPQLASAQLLYAQLQDEQRAK